MLRDRFVDCGGRAHHPREIKRSELEFLSWVRGCGRVAAIRELQRRGLKIWDRGRFGVEL